MVASPTAEADVVFRAISDPTRREILHALADGEQSVGGICSRFSISQPAISQHMKVLRDAGLVESRREWRKRIYRVNARRLKGVFDWVRYFESFWDEALDRIDDVVQSLEDGDA